MNTYIRTFIVAVALSSGALFQNSFAMMNDFMNEIDLAYTEEELQNSINEAQQKLEEENFSEEDLTMLYVIKSNLRELGFEPENYITRDDSGRVIAVDLQDYFLNILQRCWKMSFVRKMHLKN